MTESGEGEAHPANRNPPGASLAETSAGVVLWGLSVIAGSILARLTNETVIAIAIVIAVCAVTVVVHHKYGFLSRHRYGQTPAALALSTVSLIAFLGFAAWRPWSDSLANDLTVIAALWIAVVALSWSTLRQHTDLDVVAAGVALLLLGVALLLLGVVSLRDNSWLSGAASFLLVVGFLLVGVAFLRDNHLLLGASLLLLGIVSVLNATAFLRDGLWVAASGFLLLGAALLLLVVGMFLLGRVALPCNSYRLLSVALLLSGVAAQLLVVSLLVGGSWLAAVEYLLFSFGCLLVGAWLLRVEVAGCWDESHLLLEIGALLVSVDLLLTSITHLRAGDRLYGIALLLVAVPTLLGVVALLLSKRKARWMRWITPHVPGDPGPGSGNVSRLAPPLALGVAFPEAAAEAPLVQHPPDPPEDASGDEPREVGPYGPGQSRTDEADQHGRGDE